MPRIFRIWFSVFTCVDFRHEKALLLCGHFVPGDEEWESTEKRLGEKGKEFFVAMAEIKAKAMAEASWRHCLRAWLRALSKMLRCWDGACCKMLPVSDQVLNHSSCGSLVEASVASCPSCLHCWQMENDEKVQRGGPFAIWSMCHTSCLFMFPINLQALAAALINKTFLYFPFLNHLWTFSCELHVLVGSRGRFLSPQHRSGSSSVLGTVRGQEREDKLSKSKWWKALVTQCPLHYMCWKINSLGKMRFTSPLPVHAWTWGWFAHLGKRCISEGRA